MGVIKGQSIRYSIFNATAIFLGALAILFVIPYDKESYGIINTLFAAAYLMSPVIGLGLPLVIIKFHPYFIATGREDKYLIFALSLTAIITLSLSILLSFFYAEFVTLSAFFRMDSGFLLQYKYTIIGLAVLLVCNYVIISFSALYKKIAIPELFSNVAYKIFVPLMVFLVYSKIMDKSLVGLGLILFYALSTVSILMYVRNLRAWKWTLNGKDIASVNRVELFSFLTQSGVQTLANGLILRLDILLVGLILGAYQAGIYGIILFMTSTLEIASKAISQISAPIISQKWAEGNLQEIGKIYGKSAVVLTVISCLLFLLLYYNFPYIFQIMPKTEYNTDWKWVMVVLSFARIIDLGFSLNGVILTYSKLMKYNIAFLILSGVLYFILLINLLPEMGMLGAAYSYLMVVVFFNLCKHILIKWKWNLDPINVNLWKVILMGIVVFMISSFIPQIGNPWLGITIYSLVITTCYLTLLIVLKPSEDIDSTLKNTKARLMKIMNRAL